MRSREATFFRNIGGDILKSPGVFIVNYTRDERSEYPTGLNNIIVSAEYVDC